MPISEQLRQRFGETVMPYGPGAKTRFVDLPVDYLEQFVAEESNKDAYPRSYKLCVEAIKELKPEEPAAEVPSTEEKSEEELMAELEAEEHSKKKKKGT